MPGPGLGPGVRVGSRAFPSGLGQGSPRASVSLPYSAAPGSMVLSKEPTRRGLRVVLCWAWRRQLVRESCLLPSLHLLLPGWQTSSPALSCLAPSPSTCARLHPSPWTNPSSGGRRDAGAQRCRKKKNTLLLKELKALPYLCALPPALCLSGARLKPRVERQVGR